MSFHVNSLRSPFFSRGVETSIIFPLNEDDKTFLARPSLILCAISSGVTPFLKGRFDLSGKQISIILFSKTSQR